MQKIASKGGQTGTENSGFASMDSDKQVCSPVAYEISRLQLLIRLCSAILLLRVAKLQGALLSKEAREPGKLEARAARTDLCNNMHIYLNDRIYRLLLIELMSLEHNSVV